MSLTPHFIAKALSLTLEFQGLDIGEPFTTIVTDSRKIQPGCLFIALKGERFDGHHFIPDAIAQGAKGILCQQDYDGKIPEGIYRFNTANTLSGYRQIAAAWRKKFKIPLIVVAGSVGKTTTKELLTALLRGKWPKILKTEGSQNGYLGIPMTLLELKPEHQAAVIEVGIDEVGAMSQHMKMLNAHAAVLTAIGPEHLEKLKDIPTVANEEGLALSRVADEGGLVVINLDDPWIKDQGVKLKCNHKLGFTLSPHFVSLPFPILQGMLSQDGKKLELSGMELTGVSLSLPLLGNHNARNLLAAVTLARGLGLTAQEILEGLKTFQGAIGRSQICELPGPTPILCDYYNASPTSMQAGLELLSQIASQTSPPRRKWACLGDMLELGAEEEKFHREIAIPILLSGIENVLLYGPRMQALAQELKQRQYKGKASHFENHAELSHFLIAQIKPGDAVLIKGSRGMKMEEVWKSLETYALSHWKK